MSFSEGKEMPFFERILTDNFDRESAIEFRLFVYNRLVEKII